MYVIKLSLSVSNIEFCLLLYFKIDFMIFFCPRLNFCLTRNNSRFLSHLIVVSSRSAINAQYYVESLILFSFYEVVSFITQFNTQSIFNINSHVHCCSNYHGYYDQICNLLMLHMKNKSFVETYPASLLLMLCVCSVQISQNIIFIVLLVNSRDWIEINKLNVLWNLKRLHSYN